MKMDIFNPYLDIARNIAEDFMINSSYMKPNNSYKSSPLTKKQKKNRNKSKLARKARKK